MTEDTIHSHLLKSFFCCILLGMVKLNVATPSGFPEFSPAQEAVKQHWIRIIQDTFEANGFMPVTTPLVERQENLIAKGGNPKEMYVLKRLHDQEDDMSHSGNALRFDHTVPLALYVARNFNELTFPFKRYSIGPVLRGERAQKGRFRQFDQCDIDIIGSGDLSVVNDALMPAIIIQIFEKLAIGDFVVRINNRKILTGFFQSVGIEAGQIKTVLDGLDDLEKKGPVAVTKTLLEQGIGEKAIQKIFHFTALSGESNETILQSLATVKAGDVFAEGVSELTEVYTALRAMKVDRRVVLDLHIARGLDYYTGTVFETNLLNADGTINRALGSICSGGRYDDLAEVFTGKKLPGVGISIGLTRLLFQLFDAGIVVPRRSSPSDVLVALQDQAYLPQALELGALIRSWGITVEQYLEPKKLGKQFAYSDKLGIPLCIVVGENEVKTQSVYIKDLRTGHQETIRLDVLPVKLKEILQK